MGLYFRRSLIVIAILVISLIGQIALAADEESIEIWLISTPVQGINDFYNEVAQAFTEKTGYGAYQTYDLSFCRNIPRSCYRYYGTRSRAIEAGRFTPSE